MRSTHETSSSSTSHKQISFLIYITEILSLSLSLYITGRCLSIELVSHPENEELFTYKSYSFNRD